MSVGKVQGKEIWFALKTSLMEKVFFIFGYWFGIKLGSVFGNLSLWKMY